MKSSHFFLRVLRKFYSVLSRQNTSPILPSEMHVTDDCASDMIYDLLMSDKPCMIARYGSFELKAMLNAKDVSAGKHDYWGYITGTNLGWWFDDKIKFHMFNNAGFYPINSENLCRYSQRMYRDTLQLDLLGSFCRCENLINEQLKNVVKVPLKLLEPFYGKKPWTRGLQGKKVLVVHPLAKQIKKQYEEKHQFLFSNPDILPDFSLTVLEAVQSLGGNQKFNDWFEALKWMEEEIDKIEYDVCLIGCGAYGFCLAAHVKRMGKKAVHLGGVLQMLFGIYGNRWLDPDYNVKEWGIPQGFYSNMINDYWVRPSQVEKPLNADSVEGSCYW